MFNLPYLNLLYLPTKSINSIIRMSGSSILEPSCQYTSRKMPLAEL
jgi:hypothetical protein